VTSLHEEERALAPVPPPPRRGKGRGRFFVVIGLLAAGVSVLLYEGLLSSLNYFDTVDQVLAHRAQIGTESIRLEGVVVKGSVRRTNNGAAFALAGTDGREVQVINVGTPPQLFQTEIPVVVVGRFSTATSVLFLSNQIMVKHGSTYAPADAPRAAVPKPKR
jgi:cytochrome c-type biogenesis protein CcmE